MKIAITGAKGFVGKKLAHALSAAGHEVIILSRKNVDYTDKNSILGAIQGCEALYHLAAAIFEYNLQGFERANVLVTRNVVAACNEAGVKRFILVSSLAAAGYAAAPARPRVETDAPNPVSDYGITKLGAEKELTALKAEIKTTVLRPPIIYGKNDSGVSKIASWVGRGIMINTSNPGAYFSFVYVEDFVGALVTALSEPRAEGETFFVCEEQVYTWTYFIETMARAMGRKKPLMLSAPMWLMKTAAFLYETLARAFGFEPALNYDKIKEADIAGHWICSGQKWASLTGQKFTPLEQGLKQSFGGD